MSTPEERQNFPADVLALMEEARGLGGMVVPWNADGWKVSVSQLTGGLAGELFERIKATPGWGVYSPNVLVWGWKS